MTPEFIYDKTYENTVFNFNDISFREFENCKFINCDLSACSFLATLFIDCDFTECNFKDAEVNYVGIRNCNFNKCKRPTQTIINFLLALSLGAVGLKRM